MLVDFQSIRPTAHARSYSSLAAQPTFTNIRVVGGSVSRVSIFVCGEARVATGKPPSPAVCDGEIIFEFSHTHTPDTYVRPCIIATATTTSLWHYLLWSMLVHTINCSARVFSWSMPYTCACNCIWTSEYVCVYVCPADARESQLCEVIYTTVGILYNAARPHSVTLHYLREN